MSIAFGSMGFSCSMTTHKGIRIRKERRGLQKALRTRWRRTIPSSIQLCHSVESLKIAKRKRRARVREVKTEANSHNKGFEKTVELKDLWMRKEDKRRMDRWEILHLR